MMRRIFGSGRLVLRLVSFDRIRRSRFGIRIVQEDRIGFRFRLELMDIGVSTCLRSVHGFTQDNGFGLLRDGRPNFLGVVVEL